MRVGQDVAVAVFEGRAGRLVARIGRVGRNGPELGVQRLAVADALAQLPPRHAVAGRQQKLRRRTADETKTR